MRRPGIGVARRSGWRGIGGGAPASAAPFTPEDVAGLEAWYRGDDTVDSGGVVATWSDKSGNVRPLTQATAGNRPAPVTRAGQRALSFTTDFLQGAFGSLVAQPLTIYAVWETTSLAAIAIMLDGDDATNRAFMLTNTTPAVRGGATTQLGINTPATGQIYASALVANGASSAFYGLSNFVTADQSGNAGTAGLDGLTVGSSYTGASPFPGYLWEVLVYSTAHDAATRKQIGDYLTARYTSLTVVT